MSKGPYETLIKRLQDEDLSAFDEIYDLTKKAVYYAGYSVFGNQHIAEEIMQDTYLALLEKKSKLRLDIDLPAYLVTMAKNRAYDLYMKRKKEGHLEEDLTADAPEMPDDTGLMRLIKETLGEQEYMVFILRVLGEYSFKEISKMKGVPVGTLTWAYQEARKKLQKVLGEKE